MGIHFRNNQHSVKNSNKLEFFNTFKNDYTPFSHLAMRRKLSESKELVKFGIRNHIGLKQVDLWSNSKG